MSTRTATESRLADVRRRLKGTSGRGRKLKGLLILLRPYRLRVAAMFGALVLGTAASLAPAPLAKHAIDDGIVPGNVSTLNWIVVAFVVSALVVWGATFLQTYLTGWVGQRALQDLRLQIFRHLQSMPVGFYERRPAGVLVSRMTNDVEALNSLVTDSVVTLFQASLTLLGTIVILLTFDVELALITFGIFPVMALGSLAFRIAVGRRLQAHPRDDRRDHRLPAGVAVGDPRRALLRPGAAPPRALRRAQRGQPRREHEDRLPQRRLLPGRRVRQRAGHRGDPAHRRQAGHRRPARGRRARRASSPRSTASSTRSASSPSSTRPTRRAWPRWTRSSSCSTSSPTSSSAMTPSSCRSCAARSASTA